MPLHELKADSRYLVARVAVDGSTSGMITATIETKLSHVEEAALRLNGLLVDQRKAASAMLGALKAVEELFPSAPPPAIAKKATENFRRFQLVREAIRAAEAAGIKAPS